MKKSLLILIILSVIMLVSCSRNGTLEETDADASAKVEDIRPTLTESITTVQENVSPLTGRKILSRASFTADDPLNKRALSTKRIEHSYGVAKNSQPHQISVDAQNYFSKSGYKVVCYDTVSKQKVLYLTFDCGWENGYTAKCLDVLKEKNVPAAFFCTLDHIKSSPEIVARMINEGHIVGNHTASHADFSDISRQEMADEILVCDNYLRENFGYSTSFFRYPEGAYTENSLELVDSMGYKTIFWSCAYADWDVNATKGGNYAFETVTSRLHPGAIILLHSVSPDNAEALDDIIDYARKNGYEFKALTDYKFA